MLTSGKWPNAWRQRGQRLASKGDMDLCVHQKQKQWPHAAAVGLYSVDMHTGHCHSLSVRIVIRLQNLLHEGYQGCIMAFAFFKLFYACWLTSLRCSFCK